MKTNDPSNPDESLRQVLREWRGDVPLPPRFQEQVWRRIERAQPEAIPSVWTAVVYWIGRALPRPALAASYLAVILTLGLTAGWAQARQETVRVREELSQRYVRTLDPYQSPLTGVR